MKKLKQNEGRSFYLKKILCFFMWVAMVLIGLLAAVFLAFQLSPRPGAFLIGHLFNQEVTIKDEAAYQKSLPNVTVKQDLTYQSDYQRSTFDLYYPKEAQGPVPVIFWVHGGGYVGGDKEGVKEFATYVVDETKAAVISINYEWAPSLHYPGQVKQLAQAVDSIKADAQAYPMLDFDQLFFGGDSAGAQIAGQYVALQTNPAYAKEMSFDQDIPASALKGFISYCGPLDLKQIAGTSSDDRFMKFFVKTVAWSLLGKKEWQDSPHLQEISLVDKLTADFPPTYITDGNAYSFEDQGIAFANQLQALDIPVTSRFYKGDSETVTHEYQFDYSLPQAQACLTETLTFIKDQLAH
ncbi:alpha/beta hydrolase [Enterococcus sp. DIV2469a]|uniref:alpha/beta hydrolase n=1 Tax=unclassified Enterococcus TaxID=2608891 RepID=UPI003F687202